MPSSTRARSLTALLVAAAVAAAGCSRGRPSDAAESPPAAAGPAPQARSRADVDQVLASIRAIDTGLLSVSEEDGRFLRIMAAASGATHAVEIGAAYGYSAIWIGLGLRETGGHLTAIEYDHDRAAAATRNIEQAGLTDVVTIADADAFVEIPRLPGTFDFVFLDAWKPDYKKFFDLVEPRLAPGGLLLAHNVVNKADEMSEFLSAIHTDPRLFTAIVKPAGEGISVSYRRRN
jgi:predicted O-methyltransferase YrrM